MLTFAALEINPHTPLTNGEPKIALQRTHFFGVEGTSEIYGGSETTPWTVTGWIVGSSRQAVLDLLAAWAVEQGTNGQLVESGLTNRTIQQCTLDSFTPSEEGILPFLGEGSALGITAGSYYCECRWEWTQLGIGWT